MKDSRKLSTLKTIRVFPERLNISCETEKISPFLFSFCEIKWFSIGWSCDAMRRPRSSGSLSGVVGALLRFFWDFLADVGG